MFVHSAAINVWVTKFLNVFFLYYVLNLSIKIIKYLGVGEMSNYAFIMKLLSLHIWFYSEDRPCIERD